jgi:hypothetical protein
VNGDSATVEDCYRADLVEYDADTDEQVADRGGARVRGDRPARTRRRLDGHRILSGRCLRARRDRGRGP